MYQITPASPLSRKEQFIAKTFLCFSSKTLVGGGWMGEGNGSGDGGGEGVSPNCHVQNEKKKQTGQHLNWITFNY